MCLWMNCLNDQDLWYLLTLCCQNHECPNLGLSKYDEIKALRLHAILVVEMFETICQYQVLLNQAIPALYILWVVIHNFFQHVGIYNNLFEYRYLILWVSSVQTLHMYNFEWMQQMEETWVERGKRESIHTQ